MIDLTNVADYLGSLFNSEQYNPDGLIFNVTADVNVYDTAKQATASNLVIPGLVLGGTGSYEPLQGVMVYSMPVNITFWGFACPPEDGLAFTVEAQKQVISSVVEALNGTTQTFGGDAALFTGATVTVGNPTNSNGGSYTRLPILVQVVLTVVENVELSNTQIVTINGTQIMATEFTASVQKQYQSFVFVNSGVAQTFSFAKVRVFTGTFFLVNTVPFTTFEADMLTNGSENNSYTIVYKGQTFITQLISYTEIARMGSVVVVQASFSEVLPGVGQNA